MKKSLTRVLSLVLVLVLMFGVVPMAAAAVNPAGAFELNDDSVVLTVGGSGHQISITRFETSSGTNCLSSEVGATITKSFVSSNTAVATVSDSGVITAVAPGTADITVTAKASGGTTDGNPWANEHQGTKTVSVTVKANLAVSAASTTLAIGYDTTLSATVNGEAVTDGVTYEVTSGADKIALDGNKVTAVAAGDAVVTATYGSGATAVTKTVNFTVKSPEAAMSTSTMTLALGETKNLSVSFNYLPKGLTEDSIAVAWSSADSTSVTAIESTADETEAAVAGVKTTSSAVNVTAAFTVTGYTIPSVNCAVTVSGEITLACDNEDAAVGSSISLVPTLKVGSTYATDVVYTFTKSSGAATVTTANDGSKATVTASNAGQSVISVDVTSYKLNGASVTATGDNDIQPISVRVSFYDVRTVDLTLMEGKTSIGFGDTGVFSKVLIDSVPKNLDDASIKEIYAFYLPTGLTPSVVHFDGPASSSPGAVVDQWGYAETSSSWINLSQVKFQQRSTRTGTSGFTFEVLDSNGLILLKGTTRITIVGGEGDIHYETTYNKPVTLKVLDFATYWNSLDLSVGYKLEYVKFDPTGLTGTLYTDSTKATKVTSSMKFYLDPTSTQYDLGDVYYVPLVSKTTEYIDTLNFTAVDNYGLKPQYGTVTFGLNASATDISSRGIVFDKSYTADFAETYKTNTGKELGYIIFDLPSAETGKMYSSLPTVSGYSKVADGVALKRADKLYYEPEKVSELGLKNAAFVPAAGFSGKVELSYTAYDINGNNAYEGVLRLNVTKKTASAVFSDVTAKNYSWASDSVDFLYYEGTAQGSNGKYNPAANITRQDFMLMLYRAFLAEDYGTFTPSSNFPDVPVGTTAYAKEIYQAVGVAKYLGIAQGTNNKFNPKSNITRQEAMVLIYRTLDTINRDLEYTSSVKLTSMKDYSKISSWAVTAISNLVSHGVIKGNNDNIKPLDPISRAEMAAILHRVITY